MKKMKTYEPGDPNKPGDFYARKVVKRDPQFTHHGELLFNDWLQAGMMIMPPPPAPPVEDENALTLRNYGTRWRFAEQSLS